MPERAFSPYQVASLLGVTLEDIAVWVDKGWLQHRQLPGGVVRIPESSLVAFLKQSGIDLKQLLDQTAPGQTAEDIAREFPVPQPVGAAVAARESDAEDLPAALPVEPEADEAQSFLLPEPPAGQAAGEYGSQGEAEPPDPREDGLAYDDHAAEAYDPAAQVAMAILRDAVARGASHLHLEPRADGLAIRMRADGVLRDKTNFRPRLPAKLAPRVLERLSELAGAAGAFELTIDAQAVRFEVSQAGTLHGPRMVVRVRDPRRCVRGLADLHLPADEQAVLARLLTAPRGLVLLADDCREGTLTAAVLAELATPARNVLALDAGCERLDGVNYMNDMPPADLALQDPDAVWVAPLDQPATAAAALALARQTLVIAGIRAASALDAVTVFREMLASADLADSTTLDEPELPQPLRWPLSQVLLASVHGRSRRLLCEHCCQGAPDDVSQPVGCPQCDNTGYLGSAVALDLLPIEGTLARALRLDLPATELRKLR